MPFDLNDYTDRATQRAQELQDRAMAASLRQAATFDRQFASTQAAMDRAMQLTAAAAGVTYMAARSAAATTGVGFGYGYEQARRAGPQLAAAVGFGGGVFGPGGAAARGWEGPYYGGAQSFGGLLYEAGLGSALRGAFGFLPGRPFGDVNQVVGATPAMVAQRAQDELTLRMRSVGHGILTAMPLANRAGFTMGALAPDLSRDLAQRLSFIGGGDAAGGRGFRATGGVVGAMSEGAIAGLRDVNRDMGYGLSAADARTFAGGLTSGMSGAELERFSRQSPDEIRRKSAQMIRSAKQTADVIRASAEEYVKIREAFGTLFDDAQIDPLLRQLGGVAGGSLSQQQRRDVFTGGVRTGLTSGMSSGAANAAGMARVNMAGAIYSDIRSGVIDKSMAALYGATDGEQQLNLSAQRMQIGLSFGMGSPGMSALYVADPAAARRMESGQLSFLGGLQAQAGALLRDPFAPLQARFDPTAQEAMKRGGRYAAYSTARAQAAMMGAFGASPRAREAFGIAAFGRGANLDDASAGLHFRQMGFEAAEFARAGLSADADQIGAMRLRDTLRVTMPDLSVGDTARLYGGMRAEGIDPVGADPGLLATFASRYLGSANAPLANAQSRIKNRLDGYARSPDELAYYGFDRDGGLLTTSNERRGGWRWNKGGRAGETGLLASDANQYAAVLRQSGVGLSVLNDTIRAQAFGGTFGFTPDGKLGRRDAKGALTALADDEVVGGRWQDRYEAAAVMRAIQQISPDATAGTRMQEALFQESGGAGEYLLRGVSGGTLGDRVAALRDQTGPAANRYQARLQRLLTAAPGALFSEDRELAQSVLAQRLMSGKKLSAADANKAAALDSKEAYDRAYTDAFAGETPSERANREMFITLSYLRREQSTLAGLDASTRGTTPGNAIYVRDWKEK